MMKTTLLAMVLLVSALATAQKNNGFFGKKVFVDLNFRAARPIKDYSNYTSYYKSSSSGLTRGKDVFNYGMSLEVGIAGKRDMGFGINTSVTFGSIPGPSTMYFPTPEQGSIGSAEVRHERLNVRNFIIMPTLIFASRGSLLPIGFCHEFGVGYRNSVIVDKVYQFEASRYSYNYYDQNNQYQSVYHTDIATATAALDSTIQSNGSYINKSYKHIGAAITYALKVRKPITDALAFNFGLRYTINMTRKKNIFESGNSSYTINENMNYRLREFNQYSVMMLDFGLTYFF